MTEGIYTERIEKIKNLINFYERNIENGNSFFALANGDSIKIKITKNQIAHLLGVNTDFLKGKSLVKKDASSFEILNYLVDKLTYYSAKNKMNDLEINNIFSDYVDTKLEAFSYNVNIKPEDVYVIVKYDKEKTYTVTEKVENSNYFIVRTNHGKYYVLGVAKDETNHYNNIYLPVTSRMYNDYNEFSTEFLGKIVKNQEITYVTYSKKTDYSTNFEGTYSLRMVDKKETVDRLLRISNKHKSIPSVGSDFSYTINKSLESIQRKSSNASVLRMLSSSVESGNILSIDQIKEETGIENIDQETKDLIDSCNNLICSSDNHSDNNMNKYSELESENSKLKKELIELKEEMEKLKQALEENKNEKEELLKDSNLKEEKLKILINAFEEVNKKS